MGDNLISLSSMQKNSGRRAHVMKIPVVEAGSEVPSRQGSSQSDRCTPPCVRPAEFRADMARRIDPTAKRLERCRRRVTKGRVGSGVSWTMRHLRTAKLIGSLPIGPFTATGVVVTGVEPVPLVTKQCSASELHIRSRFRCRDRGTHEDKRWYTCHVRRRLASGLNAETKTPRRSVISGAVKVDQKLI